MNTCLINHLEYKIGRLGFPFMKLDGFWIRSQIDPELVARKLLVKFPGINLPKLRGAGKKKECTECEKEKLIDKFPINYNKKGERLNVCKSCRSNRARKRAANE